MSIKRVFRNAIQVIGKEERESAKEYSARVLAYWTPERQRMAVLTTSEQGRWGCRRPTPGVPYPLTEEVSNYSVITPSAVGRLLYVWPGGKTAQASAFIAQLPKPYPPTPLLFTAAHCLINLAGALSFNWIFQPIFGSGQVQVPIIPTSSIYPTAYNYAIQNSAVNDFGVFGALIPSTSPALTFNFSPTTTVNIFGYPGTPNVYPFDGNTMWETVNTVQVVSGNQATAPCLFTGGSSGGPWVCAADADEVLGVTGAGNTGLGAVSLSPVLGPWAMELGYLGFYATYVNCQSPFAGSAVATDCCQSIGVGYFVCDGAVACYTPNTNVSNSAQLAVNNGSISHIAADTSGLAVYATVQGQLYTLQNDTLDVLYQYQLGSSSSEACISLLGPVFFAACDGNLFEFRIGDGGTPINKLLWTGGTGGPSRIYACPQYVVLAYAGEVQMISITGGSLSVEAIYTLGESAATAPINVITIGNKVIFGFNNQFFLGDFAFHTVSKYHATPSPGSCEVVFSVDSDNLYVICNGYISAYPIDSVSLGSPTLLWQIQVPNSNGLAVIPVSVDGMIVTMGGSANDDPTMTAYLYDNASSTLIGTWPLYSSGSTTPGSISLTCDYNAACLYIGVTPDVFVVGSEAWTTSRQS